MGINYPPVPRADTIISVAKNILRFSHLTDQCTNVFKRRKIKSIVVAEEECRLRLPSTRSGNLRLVEGINLISEE